MPLPKDFQLSENVGFVQTGRIVDYNVNDSKEVVYANGQSYPKNPKASYLDIKVEIIEGEDKGQTFTHENVNTGIYIGAKGKSQFYVFLEMLGVKSDKLEELAEQSKPTFNVMQTVGRTFVGVRKNKDGDFYLDLRDPEHISHRKEEGISDDEIEAIFESEDEEEKATIEALDDIFGN